MAFGIAVKLDLKIKPQLNEKLRLTDNFHTSEFPYEFFSSDLSNDKAWNGSQLNLYPKAHYKFVRTKNKCTVKYMKSAPGTQESR